MKKKSNYWTPNNPEVKKHLKRLRNPLTMKFFFLFKLPSLWFWNAKITYIDHRRCEVHVPLSWSTKNPFQSIYFATQAGVAEISTGFLVTVALKGRGNFSMLVSDFSAKYTKKAKTACTFVCEDGEKIIEAVHAADTTGEPQIVTVTSIGKDKNGTIVSTSQLTWSFLKKK